MHSLRHLARTHRHWAALLFCLALLLKVVVPAGFMTVATGKTLTVELCTGTGPASVTLHIPAEPGKKDGKSGSAEQPCAFSALGAQALAATDPVLLAAALLFAFIFALIAPDQRLPRRTSHLRPPLRGPPALA
ncbi:MAG: DUF2946 family protein [Sphingomonas sp.]|nr:DUF2946 family protein [Sphingomonas sp.]